jgi:uncharacterized protein YbjT (DUF2867 family)
MFAVLGASGNTGRIVAERVLASGRGLRVVVRNPAHGADWKARGAEVAVAELTDTAALTAAFRGAEGAYVLLPPSNQSADLVAEQDRKSTSIAEAARAAGVKHVVLLSSVAAQWPAGTGPIKTLHTAENKLRAAVPNTTFVRAAYFVENFAGSLGALKDGVFPTFLRPDVAIDLATTADIGQVAADALLAGPNGHQVVELASSPKSWSPREIAALVSKRVGKPLDVVQGPASAIVPTFTSFGFSANVAKQYEEMITAFNGSDADPWERTGRFVRTGTSPDSVIAKLLGS